MKKTIFLIAVICSPLIVYCESNNKCKNSINIISYNIRTSTGKDGINHWSNRKDRVIGLFKFHGADIFGAQEAQPDQMDDLKANFTDFYYVGVGKMDGINTGAFQPIFFKKSRFNEINSGTFWLNETPEKPGYAWGAGHMRICTWIRLKDLDDKKEFYIFNTHLDNKSKLARENEAKLIIKKIAEINKDDLPMFLIGDFNCVYGSDPINIILSTLKDSENISETPHYGPSGTGGGFDVKIKDRTIDFIFVNDKIKILRHGFLTDSEGLYYYSDHLPVLVEANF